MELWVSVSVLFVVSRQYLGRVAPDLGPFKSASTLRWRTSSFNPSQTKPPSPSGFATITERQVELRDHVRVLKVFLREST